MEERNIVLTTDGYAKLEEELKNLKGPKKMEVAERIKIARDFGDLSENAEYDAARNEQARIEARINELEAVLKYAVVIDDKKTKKGVVSLGKKVDVLDKNYDEEMTFMIVGTTEADVTEGKISNESPIGNALLGRKVGETVEVDAPEGKILLEIKKVY